MTEEHAPQYRFKTQYLFRTELVVAVEIGEWRIGTNGLCDWVWRLATPNDLMNTALRVVSLPIRE